MQTRLRSLFLVLAVVAAPACSKKAADQAPPAPTETPTPAPTPAPEPTPTPTPTPPTDQPPAAGALTDPEIAAIVVAANQVDIDAGNLALKKSTNDEVKKFAQRMVTDHTAVNKAAVELVTKLKVTPVESDTSKSLTTGGVDERAKLDALTGAAFDKAYVDNEVAYHEAVIGVLTGTLIPAASNAELKATLVGVKPAFDAHLEHAKMIQTQLAGGGSATMAHP